MNEIGGSHGHSDPRDHEAVIVTCALTGAGDSTSRSPFVPITPKQIADEALAAQAAGAAIVHIHVRDPQSGKPSRELALYREVVQRIRDAGSDVLINLTTGPGGRYMPGDDPNRNAFPAGMATPEERVAHVLELKPELCSLDVATLNFGASALVNVPAHLETMMALIKPCGVKLEIEAFELGHLQLAAHYHAQGLLGTKPWFQLCLGVKWAAPTQLEAVLAMKSLLPAESLWSAFGVGPKSFPVAAQALLLGGHVRVGLEDNLYLERGVLAQGNGPLVERAVGLATALGKQVATPAQARRILELV